MTKPQGLTEAMRRALEDARDHGDSSYRIKGRSESGGHSRVVFALVSRGLLDERGNITPRGQAALAAPRVTQSQFDLLAFLSTRPNARVHGARLNTAFNLLKVGFVVIARGGSGEWAAITDAGATALNNVRAASGSADWKEVK